MNNEEKFSVTVKIADRSHQFNTKQNDEPFVREAAKIINKRLQEFYDAGERDDKEIFSKIALEGVFSKLKGEDYINQINKNITNLRNLIDKSLLS
jgi:Cell division protein ZapA